MANEVVMTQEQGDWVAPSRVRRGSWGAIFAGVFVTIAVQLMFTLLGAGVGIARINSSAEHSTQALLTGSGIWLLVTGLVSLWIGACVAGRLCGGPRRADGLLHGIVTWSVSTAVMIGLLATTLGAAVGGTASFLSSVISNGAANGNQGINSVEQAVRGAAPETQSVLPPTGRTEQEGTPAQMGQASRNLQEAGNQAAHGIEWGSFWGFAALLLGLLSAAWGGWSGTASLPRLASGEVARAA